MCVRESNESGKVVKGSEARCTALGTRLTANITSKSQNGWKGTLLKLQVLEKNGGDDGTRTRGLCRDSSRWDETDRDTE